MSINKRLVKAMERRPVTVELSEENILEHAESMIRERFGIEDMDYDLGRNLIYDITPGTRQRYNGRAPTVEQCKAFMAITVLKETLNRG
ncbi:hypothetical protein [Ralstonia phage RP13]|nr:hypothetical protein [Ralstonia phage RP13]